MNPAWGWLWFQGVKLGALLQGQLFWRMSLWPEESLLPTALLCLASLAAK